MKVLVSFSPLSPKTLTNRLQIFFLFMFSTTVKTRKLYEARNTWHSGWWALKSFLLSVAIVAPFFLPADFIQLYGMLIFYLQRQSVYPTKGGKEKKKKETRMFRTLKQSMEASS